jgi:UDP-N-acetylglucosamine acyltransferase
VIDSRAVISPEARIDAGVSIGPWCLIEGEVSIDAGTSVAAHVVIRGPTRIGRDNCIHAFSVIGGDPQDKKYGGETTRLEIGDRNTIREHCTINRGTVQGGGVTRLGNDNWIMANVHIAHDCLVGNGTVMANNTAVAGHVVIEDFAILGGFTAVHQFCRIGAYSFTAIASAVTKDVPPYVMMAGNSASAHGLNREGLKRHGFSGATIETLKRAYKVLYRSGLTLAEALAELEGMAASSPEVRCLIDFVAASTRGIAR